MFWIFLLIIGGAASFIVMGMLSVWVKVLSGALSVVVVVLVAVMAFLGLRRASHGSKRTPAEAVIKQGEEKW